MTNEINTASVVATAIADFQISEDFPSLSVDSYTDGMNASGRIFYSCLQKITETVPFDSTWSNGTGYYDGSTKAPVPVGKWLWSYDPSTNRFIILIGTRFGAVAVFERYSHGGKTPVIVCNVPRKGYTIWQTAGLNSQLGERVLTHVLGDPEFPTIAPNIGMTVETLARLFLKSE